MGQFVYVTNMNKHSNDFEKFLSGCWRVAKVLAAYYINLNICIQSLLYTYCTPQTHPNTWNARPTMVKLRILRSYSTFPVLQVAFGVSNSMIFCQWQLRQQQDSQNMPQKIVNPKHLELCYHRCSVFRTSETAHRATLISLVSRDRQRQCSSFWRVIVLEILAEIMRMRGPLLS